MSGRGTPARTARCGAVWLGATAAAATTWWLMTPLAAQLVTGQVSTGSFDHLLVRVCAAVLLPSVAWLWIITTATVGDLLRGRTRPGGLTRRLVLLACGAVVVAGAAAPATAADEPSVLAGLSLPDRAVAPAATAPRAPAIVGQRAEHVVVRPGDSLWTIAATHPVAGSDIERRWRAIWAANRGVVGDDPDLILPGQRLGLPGSTSPSDDDRTAR